MPVSVKVTLLLLILALLEGKLSNAYSPEGLKMAAGGCNAASIGEPLAADGSQNRSGLRKYALGGRKIRLEKVSGGGQYQETRVTSSSRASIEEQRQMSVNVVKGKPRMRSLLLSEKKKLGGFGAFTADYRGPMHHPPRNN